MADSSLPLDISALSGLFPSSSDYSKDYGWAVLVGVVLLGFGQEPRIKQLGEVLLQQTKDDEKAQTMAFRKLREALLKASPLVGFPRSINGLAVLRQFLTNSIPDVAKSLESDKSLRDPVPLEQRRQRGKEFFSKIYAQHTDKVLSHLNGSSGGDLGEFAINCIYGDLVAETSILNAKETGMLEFVCCLTLGATPQAKGHMYGAHNLTNNGAEIMAATKLVQTMAESLQMQWSDNDMDFLSKPKEKGW